MVVIKQESLKFHKTQETIYQYKDLIKFGKNRWTCADQVLITISVIDTTDCWPNFGVSFHVELKEERKKTLPMT